MSQRHQRWSIEKDFKAGKAFFESATSKDSVEGNAINIRNTSGDASKFLAKNSKRTENPIDYVNRLNTKLKNLRQHILNFKSSSYDRIYCETLESK